MEKKEKMRRLIEEHENAMYEAITRGGDVDYDIVANARSIIWAGVEELFSE